ncbi:DNA-3-methyladenine glycosylase 2 family protein [Candidatus Kaiserbacteria bacterium]|nr:DNA-3-methyladenine glycosylase 2 family protein [Candidatus Kaiserbacteria bacterium]
MDQKDIDAALLHFKRHDPVLAEVTQRVGKLQRRFEKRDAFTHLCRAIVGQQLSVKAAATIWERVCALYGNKKMLLPREILATRADTLRKCGLSLNKITTLEDLARHFAEENIDPKRFPRMRSDDIIAALVAVRGIGVWTAQMYLIFGLRRPDILPVGDLGFQNGIQRAYRLRARPAERTIRRFAKKWTGYESIAALYLWEYLHIDIHRA